MTTFINGFMAHQAKASFYAPAMLNPTPLIRLLYSLPFSYRRQPIHFPHNKRSGSHNNVGA
ncbi:hypothetical protein KCP70_03885 [Salmonella enterica subsp. enterica]|nr:hypothetical protein KCP70_03885 [Salmonella enterica subsp. enterica]